MIYYVGVAPRLSGHYCYTPQWARVDRNAPRTPWTYNNWDPIDESPALRALYGRLISDIPRKEQVEGIRHHLTDKGWTLLSLWDRSGDSRPGSHSTFAILGTLTADEAEAEARRQFPAIWARIDKHLGHP